MTEASAIIIPDASTLTVDTSCIDVSEVESQEDKDFLTEQGLHIRKILGSAILEIGEKVAAIQDEFRGRNVGGLKRFYASCGLNKATAEKMACSYRLFVTQVIEHGGGEETVKVFSEFNPTIAQKIYALPESAKHDLHRRMSLGDMPSREEVEEIAKKTEVRIDKAKELLEKAKARKAEATEALEEIKNDPEQVLSRSNPNYNNAKNKDQRADQSIANYQQQIADLEALVEEEKLKTAQESEEKARLETELQKLKFDDAKVRAERVKKLSTTLTVSLPQTLADVSKFFAEIDQYPDDVREHIYDTAKALANTIADKL